MLRKKFLGISVRYVSKHDHSHSGETPLISKVRKKNAFDKKLSQKMKKSLQI